MRLTDEKMIQRFSEMKLEFRKLLEFHEKSFGEIDAKAKYWLTLTLPSFVALMGYLFNRGAAMPLALLVAACSLAACLFVSTILFSNVLVARPVERGILAPESRNIKDVVWYLESDERWLELSKDQTAEMLRSIANNETQNALKSLRMRRGEASLLRGSPTAICLAGGSALLYAAACPSGFAAVATGVRTGGSAAGIAAAAGIATGLGVAAAFAFVGHSNTKL